MPVSTNVQELAMSFLVQCVCSLHISTSLAWPDLFSFIFGCHARLCQYMVAIIIVSLSLNYIYYYAFSL